MNSIILLALTENDRRLLVVLIVLLLVLFLLIGLLGMVVHAIMHHQAEKMDTIMSDVARTHVVDSPRQFKKLAFKKNNRLLYRQSLIPFALSALALLVWIFASLAMNSWGENIFASFHELFFHFEWDAAAEVYKEDPLIVHVFGISLLARFPAVKEAPQFHLEHLPAYIEVALFYVSWAWYALNCQAWIARFVWATARAKSIYSKSLKDFKAEEDVKYTPKNPAPPSED